jgi:hypothetical protein
MFVDVVNRDLPPGIAMAQIALRSVFAPVDIGVAVLALPPHVREHQVGVTVLATDLYVQTAQRESRLAVIKLRNRADRRPPLRGVAVLARDAQRAVWTHHRHAPTAISTVARRCHSRLQDHDQ